MLAYARCRNNSPMSEAHAAKTRSPTLRADAVLVAVTFVWGSSFVVVSKVVESSPPLGFLFWRFLLATLLIAPFLGGRRRSAGLARDGFVVGLLLAAGMSLQVVGQLETTASKAAFLTGLSVVLTPFAAVLRTRRLPSLENGIGIVLASIGFFLLTFPSGGGTLNRGDLFDLGCGDAIAFYIVELSERSRRHNALWLTGIQLSVVTVSAALLSWLLRQPPLASFSAAAAESRPILWQGTFLWSVLYLGSIGTVGTFFGQTWAQRHMSATHAAILFALEPVFAALLAAWLLKERLGTRGILGGTLVLAGILVSELNVRPSSPENVKPPGARRS